MATSSAHAAIDGVEIARAETLMSLRWENVTGATNWVAGARPERDLRSGFHAVDLHEGSEVAMHVPAHAVLRVVALNSGALAPPIFAVSQGTGLAHERPALAAPDARSWLLRTGSAQPSVIHLSHSAKQATSAQYALFLGRYEPPPSPIAYRHALPLPGAPIQIRRADEAVATNHVHIGQGQPLTVSVRGPDRLLLEYRLAAAESPPAALPLLMVSVNGVARAVRQLTGVESVAPVQVDGLWHAASRLERLAIDVPDGEHVLKLEASHALHLRARSSRDPDLLLPQFIWPAQWTLVGRGGELEALEQASVAAAESNRWRDISALATERWRAVAGRWEGHGSIQGSAAELAGQFTQFQDLQPVTAAAGRMHSFLLDQVQPPDDVARHEILGPIRADTPHALPVARFHRLTAEGLQFEMPRTGYPIRLRAMVPLSTGAAQLEMRHEDGSVSKLLAGVSRLAQDRLRTRAPAITARSAEGWLPGLDGSADRSMGVAPLVRAAAVEFEIPKGVTHMTIRPVKGDAELALQWGAATEYFLDDEYLAQVVTARPPDLPESEQERHALEPLRRMLASSYAQYVANVGPVAQVQRHVEESAARQSARAAASEPDPARAVELWQQAVQARDPALQATALRGLAASLLASGDRFGSERLLRAHWIGRDPVFAQVAQDALSALYARENDRAMQLLFAAAVAHRDSAAVNSLSATLAAEGEDRMAILAGLSAPLRNNQALLQSALRAGLWQTFDALLARVQPASERKAWQAQRALAWGQEREAQALFESADMLEWQRALRDAQEISARLFGPLDARASAVASWLDWQSRHPGPRAWRFEHASVSAYAGGLTLRSIPLNLRSQWWLASASRPVVAKVVGPARIRVEARPLHQSPESVLQGWLRVRSHDQLWPMPFHQNQVSPGLAAEQGSMLPGASVVREIQLPAGIHELQVDAGELLVATRLSVERPLLQLPALPAPAAAHFHEHTGVLARTVPAPECGAMQGCQLVTGSEALSARRVELEATQWPALPAPPPRLDPVAQAFAAGDGQRVLGLASDPLEKMRALLWWWQTQPSARPRVLAFAADLANTHPLPEIRSQWEQMSAASGWALLASVDRSAGLRRIETVQGAAETPVSRIRAALLTPLRPGEVRIGGDTRAALVYSERTTLTVQIELALDDVPGLPTLPADIRIERNARLLQTVRLDGALPRRTVRVSVPPGQQALAVVMQSVYANQFVRVRFTGPVEPELVGPRDWHIATRSQPVQVTLAGPVAVLIDRLDKEGVRSEQRLIQGTRETLTLTAQPGAAESLYRIYRRELDLLASPPAPPRPNRYEPTPMPEAPASWHASEGRPSRSVSFIDVSPLAPSVDHTLSTRSALARRRDTETGGEEVAAQAAQRYAEVGLTWRRQTDDRTSWLLADGLVRQLAGASAVLGAQLALHREQPWTASLPWPFSFQASLSSFMQQTPAGFSMSVTARASVYQTREITSTVSHRPSVAIMARALNLDRATVPSQVDTDVFTRYQATHRRALRVSEALAWQPWRDTQLAAQLSLVTNPDFNIIRPDQITADLHFRQLVGATTVLGGARATQYRRDSQRAVSTVRRQLRVATSTDWWLRDGSRLELATHLQRDPTASGLSGGLELRWHWSGGRGLRDFAPPEIDFSTLRSWNSPVTRNRVEEQ